MKCRNCFGMLIQVLTEPFIDMHSVKHRVRKVAKKTQTRIPLLIVTNKVINTHDV